MRASVESTGDFPAPKQIGCQSVDVRLVAPSLRSSPISPIFFVCFERKEKKSHFSDLINLSLLIAPNLVHLL